MISFDYFAFVIIITQLQATSLCNNVFCTTFHKVLVLTCNSNASACRPSLPVSWTYSSVLLGGPPNDVSYSFVINTHTVVAISNLTLLWGYKGTD